MSLVTSGISIANQVKSEKDREKARELQLEADRLKHPLKPPENYPTLAERNKNVPKGPYSVSGIRKALKAGFIPVGYSLELLAKSGFSDEVAAYKESISATRKGFQKQLSGIVSRLADKVEETLKDPNTDPLDRRDLVQAKAGEKVAELRKLAKQAMTDEVDDDTLASLIDTFKSALESSGEASAARAETDKLGEEVQKTADDNARKLMAIEARAIRERLSQRR